MGVHAVEPRGDPAAARPEESDAQLRMALANAAQIMLMQAPQHLHRVRDDALGATALEAVDGDRRHAAVAAS
jgi:hypothetical protein